MSSSDRGSPDDRPTEADGPPDDNDPARLAPPADPWLTEAPTSVLGDGPAGDQTPPPDPTAGDAPPADTAVDHPPPAGPSGDFAAGRVPPDDTARFAGAASFDDPPSGWGDAPQPEGRRNRRATRWVVAVLAVAALFIAGMLAMDQFGSGSGGDRDGLGTGPSPGANREATPTATRTGGGQEPTANPAVGQPGASEPAAGQPGASDPAAGQPGASGGPTAGQPGPATSGSAGPVVIYEVTASGSRNTGSVSYTDQDGDIIRRGGIDLPWRVTFTLGTGRKPPLVLISQRKGGGDAGPVTCTITLDGKVLSSTTAEGRYASAQCSG